MQRKFIIRTVTGLGLLAIAGCGSQPETTTVENTATTTVVVAPTTAPPKIVIEKPEVKVIEKPAPEVKKTPAKPPVTVKPTEAKKAASAEGKLGPIPKSATKLISEDIKVGTGPVAEAGKQVTVNYTGTLTDGTVFDTSLKPGREPFVFALGAGQVIPGWDQGVAGMKVGGKRRLIIPSDLGYGPAGMPPTIPGGATLVFTVELLGVQ